MDSANERRLFKQFVYAEALSFSELLRRTKMPSNLLAYFLKKMVKNGVLQKKPAGFYELSSKGEKLLPFYTEVDSITPLVVVLVMLVHGKKILLLKRNRRPYRSLWSIISGRMFLGEDISSAAKRVTLAKTGAACLPEKVSSVVHEQLVDGETKNSFVFFVVRAKLAPRAMINFSSSEEEIEWFSISHLPKNAMIASDYWLIKNRISSASNVVEEIVSKSGKKMRLLP